MYCGHSHPHDSRAPAAHADVHGFAISPIRVVFYALIIYQRFIRIPHSRLKVSSCCACFLLSAFFSLCTPSLAGAGLWCTIDILIRRRVESSSSSEEGCTQQRAQGRWHYESRIRRPYLHVTEA